MKNFILLVFCLLFITNISFAQSMAVDSLKNELQKAKHDTTVLKILNNICLELLFNSGDYYEAIQYGDKARNLAEKLLPENEDKKQSDMIKRELAKAYLNIGNCNNFLGNYSESMKALLASLKLSEEVGYLKGIANATNSLGNLYLFQKNYVEASRYYSDARKKYEAVGEKANMAVAYNNIAIINYLYENNYEEALRNLFASLKIRDSLGDQHDIGQVYNNIGEVYALQGNYAKALSTHFKALKVRQTLPDQYAICMSFTNIGSVYALMGQYQNAHSWLNRALQMANEINYREMKKDIYKTYSDLYRKLNDHKNALLYHDLYSAIKDSLINTDYNNQLADMKTRYETEKKDKEIALLSSESKIKEVEASRQKVIMYIAFSLAVLILLASIFIINYIRIKNNAQQLAKANELRQKMSRDLHDEIGSGLTTISMICEQAEIKSERKAEETAVLELSESIKFQSRGLSQKLRELVWTTNPENNSLEVLLSYMRNYVSKFFDNSAIAYSFILPDESPKLDLQPDVTRNLIFVLKEALNNCIKHSQATEVIVSFFIGTNKQYTFRITDNGKGIDYNSMPVFHSGISNMRKRIEAIKGKIDIISNAGSGTVIEITGSLS